MNRNSNMNINTRDAISSIPNGTTPTTGGASNEGDGDLNVTWPVESSHYKILGKVGRGAFATVYKALATTTTNITANSIPTSCEQASDASTNDNDTSAAAAAAAAATNTITTKLSSSLCAIKIINLEHVDTNFVDIRCEVQTMRLSSHPNILACLTSFIHHTNLWLVMQLMDKGSSLHCLQTARSLYNPLNQVHVQELAEASSQKLKQQQDAEISHQNQFEESVAVKAEDIDPCRPSKIQIQPPKIINMERHITYILHETILGLQYIHDNGQIHRDIKAGNILLDSYGNVRIADFGVSGWLVNEGSQRESARTFVGTPCWMAPEVMEQVTGYDTKADIWSLGITALELYKGYAPYAKYPPMKVLILTIQEDPPGFDTYVDEEEQDFMTGMNNTGRRGHGMTNDSSGNVNVRILEEYSASFRSMVTWCLQKDPRNRPNCEELLNHEHFAPLRDETLRAEYKQRMKEEICNQIDNVGGQDISNAGSGGGGGGGSRSRGNNPSNAMPKSGDASGDGANTIEATRDSEQDDINDPTVGVRNHNGSSALDLSITIEGEESRPKGTTWIFTDGSQVVEPARGSSIDASTNGSDRGALGNANNGGGKADDKDAFFDQFEQATQGEDFIHPSVLTEEELRKGKLCANNKNIESGKNEELDSDSDKDAINAFMDQFEEQTSQRELH